MISLWRIAAETRAYPADDLSGMGAAKNPGRWNDLGERVVYAAPTISLAVLETAAQIDDSGLPLNRFIVRIDVADKTWKARQIIASAMLPAAWRAIPAGQTSVNLGSIWYRSANAALLTVPSIIVEEESNVLINCRHPAASAFTATVIRRFEYNSLFRRV